MSAAIRTAILTVSDTASADANADKSGPTIQQILSKGGFECRDPVIVPDAEAQITSTVKDWCESGQVDLIFTTGGTGFGLRDRTPEAISPLIERPAPGLVHLLMSTSISHTPLAALSRPIAGTYKNTLIITLPGSVKAVKENVNALLESDVLGHAVELVRGGSGREVHAQLAAADQDNDASDCSGDSDAAGPSSSTKGDRHRRGHRHHKHGHGDGGDAEGGDRSLRHHHHKHHHNHGEGPRHKHSHEDGSQRKHGHHGHKHDHGHSRAHGDDHGHTIPTPRSILSHDPSQAASLRHRISPYPIITFEEALERISDNIQPSGVETLKVSPQLQGHILAEDVYAPQNVPATWTTNVDGYAIRSTDEPGTYKVLTSQTHRDISKPISEEYVYRVNTGGPIPAGTDTVIMVEDTKLVSTFSSNPGEEEGEEKEIETLAKIPKGENVRQPGSDVTKNDLVLMKGQLLRSAGGEIGTLAFVGRREVLVYKKPVIAIMSTGNEIIDLQNPVPMNKGGDWGGIFDTNRPSLTAALHGLGYDVVDLGVVPDDVQEHVKAIRRGLEEADILLTTGGTSMGPSDLLKPVIERHFNGTIHFGRSSMKPGKPTTFATVSVPTCDDGNKRTLEKPIFALPGNPASALVTFHVYVIPALRKLGGWSDEGCHLPRVKAEIQNAMPLDPRVEFHRVVVSSDLHGKSNVLKAYSTGGQRSSRVASLNGANGLAVLPAKDKDNKGPSVLEKGTMVEVMMLGEITVEY